MPNYIPYHVIVKEEWASTYRIAAIDPGSDTLGFTIIDIDLRTGKIIVVYSDTYEASRQLRYLNPQYVESVGNMRARFECHERTLVNLFNQFKPHSVIAESAFLKKRFPHSFESLTIGLEMIRRALYQYNPTLKLKTVEPTAAKKVVILKGDPFNDKASVRRGVLAYPELHWEIDSSQLDEHAFDSVAIGIYEALSVIGEFV
ncbi:hypothetical protein PP187_gp152 [Klebsiella phage vB_KvM-Eowyn]|uniref:Holliday junction resolvase n=1 Tax=Klebsiella phage vB_KvM-Eowyn TaxID=2762819 RepID=A0A7R8MJL7_9CAUD|nr:hypothetical protein PP187_gp152 [Klebsiella phage vB_KvM-Eowyn]CAD5236141.1 hypothetical protein LLCLJKAH_00152 [Klebsiella phage vB_KvM-Eowyn]